MFFVKGVVSYATYEHSSCSSVCTRIRQQHTWHTQRNVAKDTSSPFLVLFLSPVMRPVGAMCAVRTLQRVAAYTAVLL